MKATRLLASHHRKMKQSFKQLVSARANAAPLLREIADELVAHMLIEEHVFYPAVRAMKEPSVLEGFEEHVIGRFALERLLATKPSAESFKAKAKALKDIMEDHNDEEEDELFPKVEKAMSEARLAELGQEMKTLFDEGVAAGHARVLRRLDVEKRAAKPGKVNTRAPAKTSAPRAARA